jgi:hypothetical protein
MRSGRRFSLPIDPWPQASLAERTAVGMVLTFLLLVPVCATVIAAAGVAAYVSWSYEVGALLHDLIVRKVGHRSAASRP